MMSLASYQRQKLTTALKTQALAPPYPDVAVGAAVGTDSDYAAIAAELRELDEQGVGAAAVVYALTLAAQASASVHRPDLVWSGASVPGVHARKTRQVFDELVGGAECSLWISSYTYWDGSKAFARLAERMDGVHGLDVKLLLNIQRPKGDASEAAELASLFGSKFWKDWPGERRPEVYYDPRSLKDGVEKAVLHAKAVVADERAAFVTSANLTEKAFDENIEVGLLTRDRTVALSLSRHFALLIEHELLVPLES